MSQHLQPENKRSNAGLTGMSAAPASLSFSSVTSNAEELFPLANRTPQLQVLVTAGCGSVAESGHHFHTPQASKQKDMSAKGASELSQWAGYTD